MTASDTITMPVPRVLPLGWPLHPVAAQEIWDAFVVPHQGDLQSGEMRMLMALLRAFANGVVLAPLDGAS